VNEVEAVASNGPVIEGCKVSPCDEKLPRCPTTPGPWTLMQIDLMREDTLARVAALQASSCSTTCWTYSSGLDKVSLERGRCR
jgi:hypothetical protein